MGSGIAKTFEVLEVMRSEEAQGLALAALGEDDPSILGTAARFLVGWSDPVVLDRLIDRFEKIPAASRTHLSDNPTALLGHLRDRFGDFDPDRKKRALLLIESLEGLEPMRVLLRAVRDPDPAIATRALERTKALVQQLARDAGPLGDHGVEGEASLYDRNRKEASTLLGQLMIAEDNAFVAETLDLLYVLAPESFDQLRVLLIRTDTIEKKDRAKAAILDDLAVSAKPGRVRFLIHLLENRRYAPIVRQVLSVREDEEFLAQLTIELAALTPDEIVTAITAAHEYPWFERLAPRIGKVDDQGASHLLSAAKRVLRDNEIRAVFYRALSGHPSLQVQEILLSDLERLSPDDVRECLSRMLKRPSESLQIAAVKYLLDHNIPDRHVVLRPLIDSPYQEVARLAGRELAQTGFRRFLATYDTMPGEKRVLAAQAIAKLDDGIVTWALAELDRLAPKKKVKALMFFDMVGRAEEAEQALIRLIGDPDKQVRATVVNLLGEIKNLEAVKVLLRALKDPDRRVCANAIEAFEGLGNPKSVAIIKPYLAHPDNRVRANACKAIYNLGVPEVTNVLEEMLVHPKLLMRLSAVWAIGELDYDGGEARLRRVAEEDPHERVRGKAAETLARIETQRKAAEEGN